MSRDWSKFLYVPDAMSHIKDFFTLTAAVHFGVKQGKAFSVQRPSGRVEATWSPGGDVIFYGDCECCEVRR
jgi:hypothetical protein